MQHKDAKGCLEEFSFFFFSFKLDCNVLLFLFESRVTNF